MKKLRMIVTSVIVLAIVGSAFTFNAKKGAFCVTSTTSSTDCTTYVQNLKIVGAGGTQYKYYPAWDGDAGNCDTPNPGTNSNCTASFRLDID